LLSAQLEGEFYYNLTDKLNEPNLWNNITISLGPEWIPSNTDADWGNITGLKLEFTWTTDSNITSLIDGLFFHGVYKPAVEIASSEVLIFPIDAFMRFIAQWVVLGGLLFIIPKMFRLKTVWKPILIIAGFSLITLFIQTLAFTVVLFGWPEIQIPLKYLGGVSGEWQAVYIEVFGTFSTVLAYIERVIYIWTIALCAIALRLMFDFSWTKSLFVSTLSYIFSLLLFRFLIYGTIWL
jgi:hypothetical protein